MDFNNTGAMRSPFSPRVRQSMTGRRTIGSAKKNSSKYNQAAEDVIGDVIYKNPMLTLETYGAPLPVMVTEALTFGSGDVSVRMSESGWCWAVAGRRVLCWAAAAPARELTLPQTDLAHKADLVMLFYEEGAQMPSCIGVSPEGIVRYWASVGQEAFVDVSCELAGQECDRLACPGAAPLVLATTTCTLVLLTPTTVDGRATVTCKTLRPPSGWLGGIGRRVSLMFFGSMPAHVETKLVGVVVLGSDEAGAGPAEDGAEDGEGSRRVIALVALGGGAGPVLQAWRGAELHEHALRRALQEALPRAPDAPPAPDLLPLQLCAAPLDPQQLLLLFCTHPARNYLAQISLANLAAPAVTRLVALRGAPEDPRFLPLPQHVLLYSPTAMALYPPSGERAEVVEVGAEGDRLLGAGPGPGCGALVFSLRHGVLRLRTHAPGRAPPAAASRAAPALDVDCNLSLYEIDPLEISSDALDLTGKLKTAFLFHVRRDATRCRALLARLLAATAAAPGPGAAHASVDDALDRTALRIAEDMLDDMPQGDPRWKGSGGALALGRSAALQISHQLQDKRRALALYLDFLHAAGLFQRLQAVTYEGSVVDSRSVLCWLSQQLAAAASLRARQTDGGADAALIDAAVQAVVCCDAGLALEESEVAAALASGALAPADACFRRVTRLHRVLRALAAAPPAPRPLALLAHVLAAMGSARQAWAPPARVPPPPARALLAPLVDLVKSAVSGCSSGDTDASARSAVLEQAGALADALLELAAPLAAARDTAPLHAALRREAILPFARAGRLDRACALAERHGDLRLLAEMSARAGDVARLLSAARAHEREGLPELAFDALAERGGEHARTLLCRLGAEHPARLRAWLARAPAARRLRALHALQSGARARAAEELLRTSEAEERSVARASTAASLAKLCAAAADGDEGEEGEAAELMSRAEARLRVCGAHAALPRALRLRHGLDDADCRVLDAESLVRLYAEDEGALTEYDYKAALELAALVAGAERREELRLRVWCAAVRRDDWAAVDVSDPRSELSRRTFFRLVDALHVAGADVGALLPAADDVLTAPELADALAQPQARFLLRLGLQTLLADREDAELEA